MKLRLFPLLSLLVAVSMVIQGAPLPAAAQAQPIHLDPAAPMHSGVRMRFGDLEACLDAAVTGEWRGSLAF